MLTIVDCHNELLGLYNRPNGINAFSIERESVDGGRYICTRNNNVLAATGSYRLGNRGDNVYITLKDVGNGPDNCDPILRHNILAIDIANAEENIDSIEYGNGAVYIKFEDFIWLLRNDRFSVKES